MTARTTDRLRGAALALAILIAASTLAVGLAALSTPAGADPLPADRPGSGIEIAVATAGHSSVSDPSPPANSAWRTGAPLSAMLLALAGLAITVSRRDPRRAWLWTAGAGALLLTIDALQTGSSPNLEMLLGPGAVIGAGWLPGARTAPPRGTERGYASSPLLVIMACAGLTAGAMAAWSCTGAQRRELAARVVDCTALTIASHADAWRPLVGSAIRNHDWSAVRAAAMTAAREDVGCAAAAVVLEIERPSGVVEQGLTASGASPAPDPVAARAEWERLRREQLGGRRFETRAGAL